jgi:sterol desaturase/sphingolipid hydroxylase (fatty acid hydroxylase superfamily)
MGIANKPNYMFRRPPLDFFFQWRWWAAPLIFIPIALALFITGLSLTHLTVSKALITCFLGLFLWTFFEYLMHRFLFHGLSKIPRFNHVHYIVHGMHHVYPTDPRRVIFPPFMGLIIGGLIALMVYFILPSSWFFGTMAGFIVGYCWYECMHYASHHVRWKGFWLKRLKRHHLLHHHNEAFKDKNYGVTTVLWDRVFNTYMA